MSVWKRKIQLPLAPSTRGNKYQSNEIVTTAERNLIALSVILNLFQDLPPSIHEIPASAGMTVNREIVGTSLKLYSVLFPLVEGARGSCILSFVILAEAGIYQFLLAPIRLEVGYFVSKNVYLFQDQR